MKPVDFDKKPKVEGWYGICNYADDGESDDGESHVDTWPDAYYWDGKAWSDKGSCALWRSRDPFTSCEEARDWALEHEGYEG
jgi:hypothetical protein